MTTLKNFYAWLVITRSNLVARFGATVIFIFFAFLAVCLLTGGIKTLLAGRHLKRSSPLKRYSPDPALASHAADSLSMAIQIPTVTGDKAGLEHFRRFLKERYPQVFGRLNLLSAAEGSIVLRWRGPRESKEEPILFCGHMDVVPVGDDWDCDPFGGIIDDEGFIVGRGAIDCKNVVIGLMEAVDSLLAEGYTPTRDVYFAFGHDEEIGGPEGAAKVSEFFQKRGLHFAAVVDEGGYIVEELFGRKRFPAAMIGMGEKGCTYFKLKATGRAGHSSMPPRHTAVGVLSEAICRLEAAPPRARLLDVVDMNMRLSAPAMRFIHRFTVCNLPLSQPLLYKVFGNIPTVNPMLRTTLAATQVWGSPAPNILPGEASCVINARILQGDTPAGIKSYIESLLEDLPVEVETMLEIPASKIASVESPQYKKLCDIIEAKYPGLPCIPGIQSVTTDSRHYEPLCDNIYKFMPFVMDTALYDRMHNSQERIGVNCLGLGVEFYKALIQEL